MMDKVIQYLIKNLEIEVNQVTEFGPVETIEVRLVLNGQEISRSSCSLPDKE